MIEKYFKKGVRFRWQKPADVAGPQNGAIVDGMRPTAAMTYIGLGHVVDPVLMGVHVATIGLQMNVPVQHKWLEYALGRTARVPIGPYDVLTGFMSGCIITRSNEAGLNYVAHIGTVVGNPVVNAAVKQAYAAAMPGQATGFNPADGWSFQELAAMQGELNNYNPAKICALVTTTGRFFSVAFISDGNNEWTCLGCKPCVAVPGLAIKARLNL